MADRVFGPKVSGHTVLGIPLGATTEVFSDTTGGKTIPASLSVVLTAPTGASSTISSVANGQSTTVAVTPGISISGTIDDCHSIPATGAAPALFAFKFTVRASGSVRVGPFHIPINLQIDAFEVLIPSDAATHAQIISAHTTPTP